MGEAGVELEATALGLGDAGVAENRIVVDGVTVTRTGELGLTVGENRTLATAEGVAVSVDTKLIDNSGVWDGRAVELVGGTLALRVADTDQVITVLDNDQVTLSAGEREGADADATTRDYPHNTQHTNHECRQNKEFKRGQHKYQTHSMAL